MMKSGRMVFLTWDPIYFVLDMLFDDKVLFISFVENILISSLKDSEGDQIWVIELFSCFYLHLFTI
jgi:hypothetical protein